MKHHLSSIIFATLVTLGLGLFTGCGGGDKSSAGFPSTPPEDDDDPVVSTTGFYVRVTANDDKPVTTYLHKFNSFTASCEIPTTTTTPTDLQCILNVKEVDLFLAPTQLEINVPPGMCKYFYEYPYWYWDRRPGKGPSSLSATITDGVMTACSADSVAGAVGGGGCSVADGFFESSGEFKCAYDYSLTPGYPNCCGGTYGKTLTTITAGTPTYAYSNGAYGGKIGNCAGGPGVAGMDWPTSPTSGLPSSMWTYVPQGAGHIKITEIPAAIDVDNATDTSVYSANMYGWTNYVAGTHSAATLPTGLSAPIDLSGDTLTAANPAYVFGCYDSARELKHRIRVYINEWDTNENFEAYATSAGNTANSPNSGATDVEGIQCDVSG
ncbi:MAG: hypothetical protein AAB250_10695, partial [Bdellovibrionota bacterium]